MHFFKPTAKTALAPLLLILFAVLDPLLLRFTLYSILSVPLQPLIHRLGWVYHDKPWLLTYPASLLSAGVWAVVLFILLCVVRFLRRVRAPLGSPRA